MPEHLTLGECAREVGALEGPLRKLVDRRPDLIPHIRAGRMRIFRTADLPTIRRACEEAKLTKGASHAATA